MTNHSPHAVATTKHSSLQYQIHHHTPTRKDDSCGIVRQLNETLACWLCCWCDMRHAARGQQWPVLGLVTPNRSKWSKVSFQVCPAGSCSTPLCTTSCHVNARHVYTIHFRCHRFQSISKPMQAKLSPLEILNPDSTFTFSLRGTKKAGFHKTFGYPPSFSQHFQSAFILAVIWLAAGNAAAQITWKVKDLNGQGKWKWMLQQSCPTHENHWITFEVWLTSM